MKKRPLTEAEKKERQRQAQRRWRKLHPDYNKEWHVAHRDYVAERKRKYRERKKYGNEI